MHGHSLACFTALLSAGENLDLYEKDMYGRTPEDILKEIQGRGRRKTETQKAIRKDHRKPWRELSREFVYEKKRRKDALYLRKQEMQEKQDAKDRAAARLRQGAKAKLDNAIADCVTPHDICVFPVFEPLLPANSGVQKCQNPAVL